MKIINLRLHYPHCQQDKLVEVSEEVFDVLPVRQGNEERAERDRLASALREALAYATPTQARRVCAYYLGGLIQQQIADRERVHNSNICLSIRRGLCNLRRYYADHPQGK